MLIARNSNEIKGNISIPLLENDISEKDFRITQKSSKTSTDYTAMHSDTIGFVKRIRTHELLNQARLAVPPHVDNFVREERIPEVVEQKSVFDMLFPQYRPLHPIRTERKAFSATNPDSCKIVVQVLRGFNFPSRIKSNKITQKVIKTEDDEADQAVFIFIRITYLDYSSICRSMLSKR